MHREYLLPAGFGKNSVLSFFSKFIELWTEAKARSGTTHLEIKRRETEIFSRKLVPESRFFIMETERHIYRQTRFS